DEGPDPAPAVRRGDPGRHRFPDHRPDHGQGPAQERPRQMLWWRRHPQEEAPREAEGGQEAYEAGRARGNPAGGLPRRPAGGQQVGGSMKLFEIGLVALTFATGIVWLLDRLFFARRRREASGLPEEKEPILVDYSKAFFPVLFVVLVLRSFIAEPFRIPSSSMMPTLLIGDFILVNKFSYGIRLPITNRKVIPVGEPQRGDVVVFRPPHHPDQDWIKRVIGLPGDVVA